MIQVGVSGPTQSKSWGLCTKILMYLLKIGEFRHNKILGLFCPRLSLHMATKYMLLASCASSLSSRLSR